MNRLLTPPRFSWLLAGIGAVMLISPSSFGQGTSAKKAMTFHGKVESVDQRATSLKVDGENVDGWMNAMTMSYKVDNPAVLKEVKPGDQIMATVYKDDMVLHNVMVMKNPTGKPKPKK